MVKVCTLHQKLDLVKEQCLVDSSIRHANHALNLDGYIWAVSSLAYDRIQVCCLEETHLEPIVPPLTLYLHW